MRTCRWLGVDTKEGEYDSARDTVRGKKGAVRSEKTDHMTVVSLSPWLSKALRQMDWEDDRRVHLAPDSGISVSFGDETCGTALPKEGRKKSR